MKLKRQVLDALDKAHDFALPETLVDSEFDGIWKQVDAEPGAGRQDASPTRARPRRSCKAEYRKIAERRVRLGLVIGEIGEKSKIAGDPGGAAARADRAGAPLSRARSGSSTSIYEKNPAALIELRAPIFEDKVIDHILEQAKPDREEGDAPRSC